MGKRKVAESDTVTRARARRGRPPRRWRERFLEVLSEGCLNIRAACRAAHVHRCTAYRHRKNDPDFAAAWDEALQIGIAAAEDVAWSRAMLGVVQPVFQGGKQVGSIIEYDNNLLIQMLAAHKPEVYGRRLRIEGAGPRAVDMPEDEAEAELRRALGLPPIREV
jgi:hypothetical protein